MAAFGSAAFGALPRSGPAERVAISGGGLCGWLAACLLARHLPHLRIVVHPASADEETRPDRSLGVPLAAEVLLPGDLEHIAAAGLRGGDLIRHCRGSFMLGTALTGWRAAGGPAFVPFGEIGAPLGPVPFHQIVAAARARGHDVNMANYALGALCAQTGRFAPPRSDDASVLSQLSFGLAVESDALRRLLRDDALAHGVQHGEAVADPASLCAAADLVIDARGAPEAWSENGGEQGGEDWSALMPFDRALVAKRAEPGTPPPPPPPYAHLSTLAEGWQGFVPLAGAMTETLVFAAAAPPAEVTGALPEAHRLAPGRSAAAWQGAIVRMGAAAQQHDPVAGLQLHLALADVVRLIALFPANADCAVEAAEYNRQWRERSDCAFDYTVLRLARNGAKGAVWDRLRAAALPHRTAYRHDLYAANGRIALHDGEVFETPGWVMQFEALGIRPRRPDALAMTVPDMAITAHFEAIRKAMLAGVAKLPPHGAVLAEVCA